MRNIFSPARRIHTRCSHLTWKHRLVIFNLGYCECETLYPAAVWFTARDFSTQTETHTAVAEAKIELVWAFLGCLKHHTYLWPLRFNKDYKTHAEEPLLCSRASSPYASSQSRGDVSWSTNVNIAARVRELSNTLTHNLFTANVNAVRVCDYMHPQNAKCALVLPQCWPQFLYCVCTHKYTHTATHTLENLCFLCTFFFIISDMWQKWKKKKIKYCAKHATHVSGFICQAGVRQGWTCTVNEWEHTSDSGEGMLWVAKVLERERFFPANTDIMMWLYCNYVHNIIVGGAVVLLTCRTILCESHTVKERGKDRLR